MTLTATHLSSGYRRSNPIIEDVSFHIADGEIIGLIGLNGAGKSTLIKTLLTLLPTQSGTIALNEYDSVQQANEYVRQLAYIPETPVLYEELTLKEHLEMTALGYGIPIETVMQRAQPLLQLFRLDKQLNWFPTHFSKGMKQKVMIICALVTDAPLLMIDEPFLGLDPLAMKHFTQLLKEHVKNGGSVLLTTHVLGIADDLCQRYLMLQAGQIIAQGTLEALQTQFDLPHATLEDIYLHIAEGVTTS